MTEFPRKTSLGGLVSSISSKLSGRPSRQAYEELRDDQEEGASANALPKGKAVIEGFTSAISGGGLTARPSRKAGEDTLGKSSPYPVRPTPVEEDAQAGSKGAEIVGTLVVGARLKGLELLKAWLAVILLTLLAVLVNMGGVWLNYLNKTMGADISMSDAQYGMVQGYAYDFVFGISMLAWGFIADKFRLNRVYLLVGGCAMTAVTLIMEAYAKSFTVLLLSIVIKALASGVVQNIPFAILSDILPPEQLGLGGGVFGSATYVAQLLCGNISYATLQRGIHWHWPIAINAVAVFAVSVAVALSIKEPPVGRFFNQRKDEAKASLHDFDLKASLLYFMAMDTFWMLTLAAGFRMMSTSVLAAFLPDYSQQAFMHQPTVFAAESTVLGFCGFLSAILIGMLCERLFVRMPAVSLYTSCIGALAASVFMALTLFATLLLRTSNARYAAFLSGLSLSTLCSEGWIGPVTCLVALILPPEIKAFGLALWWAAATVLIMPLGNVLCGIYLTAGGWLSGTPAWLPAARYYLAGSIIGGYIASAAFCLASARLMPQDTAKLETVMQTGSLSSVALTSVRRLGMYAGLAAVVLMTMVLMVLSFVSSYYPKALASHGR